MWREIVTTWSHLGAVATTLLCVVQIKLRSVVGAGTSPSSLHHQMGQMRVLLLLLLELLPIGLLLCRLMVH